MAPHIYSAKPLKSQLEVPSGTSVDEPGGKTPKNIAFLIGSVILFQNQIPLRVLLHPAKDVFICNSTMSGFGSTFQVREQIISLALQTA